MRIRRGGCIGWAALGAALAATVAAAAERPAEALLTLEEAEAFLASSEKARGDSLAGQARELAAALAPLLASDSALIEGYQAICAQGLFAGQRDRFEAWQQKQKDTFKSEDFRLALRLHLRYVLATLAKRAGNDANAVDAAQQWIGEVLRTGPRVRTLMAQPLMAEPVSKSVFFETEPDSLSPQRARRAAPPARGTPAPAARADAQARLLAGLPHWHLGPLAAVAEIHRVNVLGPLRAQADPALFEAWKHNLRLEEQLAELAGRQEAFLTDRRPWVLWQIGKDYARAGRPREAVSAMVSALRGSPRCADYEAIAAEIRKVVEASRRASAPVPPADAPRPAPEGGP